MRPSTLVLSLLMFFALGAMGCQSGPTVDDNGPDVAAILASPQSFVGTDVSMKGLPVFWTATYITSDGVVALTPDKTGWLCVVVVNARRPTEGILLCTRSEQAIDVFRAQKSVAIRIEGPVKTFLKTDLVAYVKKQFGCDLVTTKNGEPLWIEDHLPVHGAASPAPGE